MDFLHSFGAWCAVEDGLYRPDVTAVGTQFWFPEIQQQSNEKGASK